MRSSRLVAGRVVLGATLILGGLVGIGPTGPHYVLGVPRDLGTVDADLGAAVPAALITATRTEMVVRYSAFGCGPGGTARVPPFSCRGIELHFAGGGQNGPCVLRAMIQGAGDRAVTTCIVETRAVLTRKR